jgi:hypothetical protein
MALPSSGNTISLSQVNTELGRSATATIDMNDSGVRSLFQKTGSGTTISMSDGWGKANFTVAYSSGFGNGYFIDDVFYSAGAPAGAGIRWNTNGTMDQYGYSFGYQSLGQTWGNPTTSGIGSNYWIRFTRTATGGFGAAAASTASTGWLQLTSPGREITIYQDSANQITAEYTVEISSSSSGSPVLTTRTGITIGLSNGYL